MKSMKRPKSGETEEDLLRQQKEFLSQKQIQETTEETDDCTHEDTIADNHDLPHIVTHIVEKNVNNLDQIYMSFTKRETNFKRFANGFPKAVRRSDGLIPKSGKSLFAQQMSQNCERSGDSIEDKTETTYESVVTGIGLGTNDWKSEVNQIREENQLLVQRMDKKEIQDLKSDLLSKLSQKTIDFLVNKKVAKSGDKPKVENNSNDIEMSETNVRPIDEKDLPIKQMEVMDNKWMNMDVIEKEKMSWIGDIEEKGINTTDQLTKPSLNARFDFEANLMDNSSNEVDVRTALYHHRSDESKAGYSIDELYVLIQSTFSSQKVLGLQVLSKIMIKSYNGLFDDCFNENLIQQLMKNSALVLVTRIALDDNTETVWRTAINALHSMLCNTSVDEVFLDRGFTLFRHSFKIDESVECLKPSYDSSKLDELSDEQLMALDVIQCLLKRTALLQRIRYLLEFNKSRLDSKSVNDLLDILIRISRHSVDSMQEIIKCPFLLETIVNAFIPVSVVTTTQVFDKPNPKALKLIRLLVSSDLQTTNQILDTFPQIIESLKVYLTLNPENCANSREVLELSIESLRVWVTLLSQGVCCEGFWQMFPIIVKQLQYCSTVDPIGHQNNYDLQYASTLILVVRIFVEQNPSQEFKAFNELVFISAMKWLSLIKNTVSVPNFDANVCLMSAIEYLLVTKFNAQSVELILTQIIDSKTFLNKLINNLTENSNLVQMSAENNGYERDSSNLPSFGSIHYKTLKNPSILNNESSIALLLAIIHVMKTSTNDKMTNKLQTLKEYVIKVTNNLKYDSKLNSFDFIELNLMTEICLLSSSVIMSTSLAFEDIHCYLNLSVLMICFIKNNTIKQKLLNELVFNKSIHCLGITASIAELSLNEEVNKSDDTFNSIKSLYEKYSNFDCFHWVFDPIVKPLKDKTHISAKEVNDCLTFISLLIKSHYNYFKQLITSSSALVCLISSVFLSEEVFFDKSIEKQMYFILKELSLKGIDCQIEERIPYFETTGDFFMRFVEQFESISYGNQLFVNYLLLFCKSKSSSLFRHKLFAEFPTALPLIRIDFKEILTPIECFLSPIERDSQTLESYLKALLCGALTPNNSPIMYLIAVHHLNHSLFRNSEDNTTRKKSFERLIRSVHNSNNDSLKRHLKSYSHFDPKLINGLAFELNF